jgi:NAD(P)H-flavin reductase
MFRIFKKKSKSSKTDSKRYLQLKIKEVRRETDDTNTLIFEKPEKPLRLFARTVFNVDHAN